MATTTRRGHNEGSIRKRPDGTWEARLSLANGKRKSFYAKTRREVQDKLRDSQRDLERGLDLTANRLTVRAYLNGWMKDAIKDHVRPSTYQSYKSHVDNYLVPALGHLRLRELNAAHVNKMLRDQALKGVKGKPLSPRSRAYTRSILRRALNDAMDADLVPANAAAKSLAPTQRSREVVPLTPEQAIRFLAFTRNDTLGPLFHVAIGTGLRQGELLALRWRDLDLDESTLTVRHSLQRIDGKPALTEPKTSRSRRRLALDSSTVAALKRQKVRQAEARLLAGQRWRQWELVFTSSIGTPLNPSNVTHRFQALIGTVFADVIEAGEFPHQRFHDLRHCAASLLLANGADLREIMEQLGHSQISLTANTYTHLSEQLRRATATRMETALRAVS